MGGGRRWCKGWMGIYKGVAVGAGRALERPLDWMGKTFAFLSDVSRLMNVFRHPCLCCICIKTHLSVWSGDGIP